MPRIWRLQTRARQGSREAQSERRWHLRPGLGEDGVCYYWCVLYKWNVGIVSSVLNMSKANAKGRLFLVNNFWIKWSLEEDIGSVSEKQWHWSRKLKNEEKTIVLDLRHTISNRKQWNALGLERWFRGRYKVTDR